MFPTAPSEKTFWDYVLSLEEGSEGPGKDSESDADSDSSPDSSPESSSDSKSDSSPVYNPQILKDCQKLEKEILEILEQIPSKSLVKTVNSIMREESLPTYQTLYKVKGDYEWSFRFFVDRYRLYKHGLTVADIAFKIEETFRDAYCVFFPESVTIPISGTDCGILDVYIDTSVTQEDISNIEFMIKDNSFMFMSMILPHIGELPICGIPGIDRVYIKKTKKPIRDGEKPPGSLDPTAKPPEDEWAIETEGSNILGLFESSLVDHRYINSNDLWELMTIYGIEVARTFLITELTKIISASGSYVNSRHLELLADKMTHTGKIIGISRYGMNRKVMGPLSVASFEQTLMNFKLAAFKGEKDLLRNGASQVITGKTVSLGTNNFQIAWAPSAPSTLSALPQEDVDYLDYLRKEAERAEAGGKGAGGDRSQTGEKLRYINPKVPFGKIILEGTSEGTSDARISNVGKPKRGLGQLRKRLI